MTNLVITVVGAGVSGLTTALVLQEKGFFVRLVAREFGRALVSTVAGAQWEMPPAVCGFYEDSLPDAECRERNWAEVSYQRFYELAKNPLKTGVYLRPVTFYLDTPLQENFREKLKFSELSRFAFGLKNDSSLLDSSGIYGRKLGYIDAYSYLAPQIDTDHYLSFLLETFLTGGGSIEYRQVNSLVDILKEADYVVNATGLGSRHIVEDRNVIPVRGAWFLVYNNGVDFPKVTGAHCTSLASSSPEGQFLFIVPRGDNKLVLGGIAQPEKWSTERNEVSDAMQAVLNECTEFMPDLRKCRFVEDGMRVGLRPFRQGGVRCEILERIIHNYGHGGSGVTLSWGCAQEVANLIARHA